jgi:hypothetical protein
MRDSTRNGVVGGRNGEGPRSPIGMISENKGEKIRSGLGVCVCVKEKGQCVCGESGRDIYVYARMANGRKIARLTRPRQADADVLDGGCVTVV